MMCPRADLKKEALGSMTLQNPANVTHSAVKIHGGVFACHEQGRGFGTPSEARGENPAACFDGRAELLPAREVGDAILDPLLDATKTPSEPAPQPAEDRAERLALLRRALGPARFAADVDVARIADTQRYFRQHATAFGLALLAYSLPLTYCAARGGVQSLELHGGFSDCYAGRMLNTMRWMKHVMTPTSEASTVEALHQLRATHALARHRLRNDPRWQSCWGLPISQEALLATLIVFSTIAAVGIRKLGLPLSVKREQDLLYTWSVFGELLGLDKRRLPRNLADARELWRDISVHHFETSAAGCRLAAAHVRFLARALLPVRVPRWVTTALVAHTLGERLACLLELRSYRVALQVAAAGVWLWALFQRLAWSHLNPQQLEAASLAAWRRLADRWSGAVAEGRKG